MRYVVTELEGWPIKARPTEGAYVPGLSVHVIDTAVLHRVMRTWRTEDAGGGLGMTRDEKRRRARAAAAELAADLNRQDEARRVAG